MIHLTIVINQILLVPDHQPIDTVFTLIFKGISVKGSKQFTDLKQKLIQVRMLLTGLTLSQDIDILNASKQDVASLTSKQTRLLDLFTRCKDVVNKIQSLKRGATTTINEEQGN